MADQIDFSAVLQGVDTFFQGLDRVPQGTKASQGFGWDLASAISLGFQEPHPQP